MRRYLSVVLVSGLATACGGGGSAPGNEFTATPKNAAPDDGASQPSTRPFFDATTASNIDYVVGITPSYTSDSPDATRAIVDMSFGGAAAGDCDADGDVDLFITYGDGVNRPNRLYLNQWNSGNPLRFRDHGDDAGVAYSRADGAGNDRHSGPTFADMDGDGDLDLFVGGLFGDPNKVYRNRGDCTFEDVSSGSGIEQLEAAHTFSSAFGDFDLDGDLDLFLTHWGSTDAFADGGESEHLFRNLSDDAGIRFENVSAATYVTAHIVANRSNGTSSIDTDHSLTPTFARINDDPWPDIALVADFGTAQLLLNDIDLSGTFVDRTDNAIRAVQYGMGSALADIDFDGDLDWFVTSIFASTPWQGADPTGNRIYLNPGGDLLVGGFENITGSAGVADGGWGWAACFLDIDNDADLDIYHTNGWPDVIEGETFEFDASRVFVSDGAGVFTDRAAELGLNDTSNARGVVCADFDNDGDVDILQLTNDSGNSATLWENRSAAEGNNFLRIQLLGLPPNTEAAGVRIFATIGAKTQMREITIGSNYTSQNPTVQIFGLGTAIAIDELRVEWPALLPGPGRPADWIGINIPAGTPGETLVVCHPGLAVRPPLCSP